MRKRRQSRTGHGRKTCSALGDEPRSPAYPPPKSGSLSDPDSRRKLNFFGHTRSDRLPERGANGNYSTPIRPCGSERPQSWFNSMSSAKDESFSRQCVRDQAAMARRRKRVFKRNLAPLPRGAKRLFWKLSSDAIKFRAARQFSESMLGDSDGAPDRPSRPDPWSRTARRAADRFPWRPPAWP